MSVLKKYCLSCVAGNWEFSLDRVGSQFCAQKKETVYRRFIHQLEAKEPQTSCWQKSRLSTNISQSDYP